MNTRDKITKAQTEIIDNLAACEEAISRLYALYGRSIPDMTEFWQDLSKQEEKHADLLRSMHKQLAQGIIFENIGRFGSIHTGALLQKINDAIKHAEASPTAPREAIETAIGIESSILDANFYDIVKSDSAVYKIIANRLSSDTRKHVTLVQNKLLEILAKRI